MTISYNTGTTSVLGGSASNNSSFTIPSSVLPGDVIFVLVFGFTTATGTFDITLGSTATTPVKIGTDESAANGGITAMSAIFSINAKAADPGATLTYTMTGGTGGQYWFNVGLVSYTGATIVDVNAGTSYYSTNTGTTTTPSATTKVNGDWQIQFLGVGPNQGNNFTIPGGLTNRQAITGPSGNAGLLLNIADSNGSVGNAGTAIGNTTWVCGPSTASTWSTSFTVGLQPARPVYTAFGTNGNNTGGSASSLTLAGGWIAGTLFEVTSSGYQISGYGMWCCDATQAGSTIEFALWQATGAGTGTLVANSTATLGPQTPGTWSYVSLATPIPLVANQIYKAQAGTTVALPWDQSYFGTAGAGINGFLNGPLKIFSSSAGDGGASQDVYGDSQANYHWANPGPSDPTSSYVTSDFAASNPWIDVQITQIPQANSYTPASVPVLNSVYSLIRPALTPTIQSIPGVYVQGLTAASTVAAPTGNVSVTASSSLTSNPVAARNLYPLSAGQARTLVPQRPANIPLASHSANINGLASNVNVVANLGAISVSKTVSVSQVAVSASYGGMAIFSNVQPQFSFAIDAPYPLSIANGPGFFKPQRPANIPGIYVNGITATATVSANSGSVIFIPIGTTASVPAIDSVAKLTRTRIRVPKPSIPVPPPASANISGLVSVVNVSANFGTVRSSLTGSSSNDSVSANSVGIKETITVSVSNVNVAANFGSVAISASAGRFQPQVPFPSVVHYPLNIVSHLRAQNQYLIGRNNISVPGSVAVVSVAAIPGAANPPVNIHGVAAFVTSMAISGSYITGSTPEVIVWKTRLLRPSHSRLRYNHN